MNGWMGEWMNGVFVYIRVVKLENIYTQRNMCVREGVSKREREEAVLPRHRASTTILIHNPRRLSRINKIGREMDTSRLISRPESFPLDDACLCGGLRLAWGGVRR